MSAIRAHRDYLYYLIYGSDYIDRPWSHLWGRNDYDNDFWQLFVRPTPQASNVGLVDMSNENMQAISIIKTETYKYESGELVYASDSGVQDMRTADRLSLDHQNVGPETSYKLALQGVEFVDAPVDLETHLQIITKNGFTTDGTLASIMMHVGHQEMTFTGAARDSTIFMGAGYDKIAFVDHLDVPGQQYWSVIRRPDGELDVYSLFSGYRVQLGEGYKGWTAAESDLRNYGEIEEITIKDARTGETVTYLPGVDLPYDPEGEDIRGTATNIDLRSDGKLFSDSFNLAYFNFIRYTSDNVWAGEATIHDGTLYSTPSDRTVTTAKYGVDAPVLSGTMSVVGQSRNGTHDLIVAEQEDGKAIDGFLRLYAFDVESRLYNQFNQVFLGSAAGEIADKKGITRADWTDRVALYGFGGNDALTGGAGRDYIFGGESDYNQLSTVDVGNIVTGGGGADYFGVGNTDSAGAISGANTVLTEDEGDFLQGYATDVIMDWDAGQDSLVVLSNGVAVIGGLYGTDGMDAGNTIDLRATKAIATSDQDFDGARGGSAYRDWDASTDLTYAFQNQGKRDAHSIANEADVTVVNEGLIVSRGLGGDDTVWGSVGQDYIYGGDGKNYLNLGVDTAQDRAFVDQFVGMQVVRQFDNGEDKIYLNVDAIYDAHDRIDYLNPHGAITSRDPYYDDSSLWVNNSAATNFFDGRPSAFGLDLGALDIIYYPWSETYLAQLNSGAFPLYTQSNGAWRNVSHNAADGLADLALGIAGGVSITLGTAMLFNPFTAVPGAVLVATGGSQIAAVLTSEPHLNAVYETPYDIGEYYVNYLTAAKTVTTQTGVDDTPIFTDFFWDKSVSTTFAKAVEFVDTRATGGRGNEGITTFAVLKSSAETFIYYIQSEDNIVTDNEARLVAEIESLVPVTDLVGYKGDLDIYNQNGVVQPIYPQAATLSVAVDGTVTASGRMKDDTIVLTATLDGPPNAGDTISFYNGSTLLSKQSTITGKTVYSYTHSVDVLADKDTYLNYMVVTKSSQGFEASSNVENLVFDDMPPQFPGRITASDSGTTASLQVSVSGTGVSEDEPFTVSLVEIGNSSNVAASAQIKASGDLATLTLTAQETARTFELRATDALGNVSAYKIGDDTAVFHLGTNDPDTYNNASGTASQVVFTFGGADSIRAGSGDDVIVAGGGSDTITGGTGVDILTGGDGNDVFVYGSSNDSTVTVYDTISDFTSGSDKIDLSGVMALTATGVTDLGYFAYSEPKEKSDAFATGYAAADTAMDATDGKLIFFFDDGADGYLVIDTSADDATPDMVIHLAGITSPPILASDFIL